MFRTKILLCYRYVSKIGMDTVRLGCMTFVTTAVPHDKCGSNGLPVTPNSVKVLGLAQELISLRHENVCRYIDFKTTKHNRIFAVSEYYTTTLHKMIKNHETFHRDWNSVCVNVSMGVFKGLSYLHEQGLVHHCLEPKSIYITKEDNPKLGNFGLHHITDGGSLVDCPIGNPKYHAPEHVLHIYSKDLAIANIKSDVWSSAIVILELINKSFLWEDKGLQTIVSKILELTSCQSAQSVLEVLQANFQKQSFLDDISQSMRCLLESCLSPIPENRLMPAEILNDKNIFKTTQNDNSENIKSLFSFKSLPAETDMQIQPIEDLDLQELWHLWKLAGGDLLSSVFNSDTTTPSVRMLPFFITNLGGVHGLQYSPEDLFDAHITVLPMEAIENRLATAVDNPDMFYPLLENKTNVDKEHATSKLPLLIRENDFEYQVYRLALFRRLLIGYPYLHDLLWKEARIDIPVLLRGLIWAGLLNVQGDVEEEYMHIDKDTPKLADRQIAVDVPRCHQYNAILSSPVAHEKLKRVLKAWLFSHPHLSYWQGLDSLCAVFVHLNFNDEPTAYKSMSHFIDKYLYNFFLKDNSAIIQEYLVVFAHLVSFHDPLLSCHMNEIGFIPDLYAIPWFLTMFAHVFPLHKIVHLWDTLLLGNSSFPLCIGVAILQQVREQLLLSDFNECILLFSDLPEVNIDNVVQKSIQIFCHTPKSSTFRVHAQHESNSQQRTMSYYSDDYNVSPQNELSLKPIPLADLKEEVCCRISADDLIQLTELGGIVNSKTPAKNSKSVKPRIAVIDIRQPDEFAHGAIPEGKNFPYSSSKSVESCLQYINQLKPKVVVVVGNCTSRFDRPFASKLLKAGTKGVCVLFGGIEILKPVGILTIPSL
uniref:TBC domain-containing protein kinase-like protein n=1 Tax=Phallusia mammillata TaxID=59560 RepID=A0A6F9DTU8_9ASCI|nr:TBC domain-containing protein kinase-like protein [Phallusia mammillata]